MILDKSLSHTRRWTTTSRKGFASLLSQLSALEAVEIEINLLALIPWVSQYGCESCRFVIPEEPGMCVLYVPCPGHQLPCSTCTTA